MLMLRPSGIVAMGNSLCTSSLFIPLGPLTSDTIFVLARTTSIRQVQVSTGLL